MTESDLRYSFACPSCGGSFSISLSKIPPVQARFSCPKCSKPMDFPSRDEARVYIQLQAGASSPTPEPAAVPGADPEPPATAAAKPAPIADEPPAAAEKRYRVEKKGFENDEYDRRAMRNLIRTGALNENDTVVQGVAAGARADTIAELKSLFELRKTARASPPPVCRKHTDVLAHYQCGDTGRPLCDECAPEKKFGGTSVRVCDHCGGTAGDLHAAPGDLS